MEVKALDTATKHADKACLYCGAAIRYREHTTVWKRIKFCSHKCSCDYRFHSATPAEKFWRRVLKLETGCWEFQGCRDKWGYAHYGHNGRRVQAHRHAYELTHGQIPKGRILMHSCDNPPCVNPAHLSIGTDADNVQDKVRKGRHPAGTEAWNAKLTAEQVLYIRETYKKTGARKGNGSQIAKELGISPGTVHSIGRGDTWKVVK